MKKDSKTSYQKTVSEEQVIDVAKSIADNGQSPTIATIRKHLNYRGSNSTIHKYLSKWKIECYQKASKIRILAELNNHHISDNSSILEEKVHLERTLDKQITKNEYYAQELMQAEKTIIILKEENQKLKTENQRLELKFKEVNAIKITLEKINEEIQNKLGITENDTINKQKLLIEELQQELKNLNAKSMQVIQETSSQGHEILMQEKVHVINLQAKIDHLSKEAKSNPKTTRVRPAELEKQVFNIKETNGATTKNISNQS